MRVANQAKLTGFAIILVILALSWGGLATASEGEFSRRIIGLCNSKTWIGGDARYTQIHTVLEMPLNFLGFNVEWVDINGPLPDVTPYRAILVWSDFYTGMEDPERLFPWLIGAVKSGVKLIFPDSFPLLQNPDGSMITGDLVIELTKLIGLENMSGTVFSSNGMRIRNNLPEYFSFESDLIEYPKNLPLYRVADPGLTAWQEVGDDRHPDRWGATVVVGDKGAWAIDHNVMYYEFALNKEDLFRMAWNIDPFAFLNAALDCAKTPRPDVTTFWGARGAYSHTDVDGPANLTQDFPGPQKFALEKVYEGVVQKYPVPTTFGYVPCDFITDQVVRLVEHDETPAEALARPQRSWQGDNRETGSRLRELAAKIQAYPHIQSGSHGYTHPLDWKKLRCGYAVEGYEANYEMETRGGIEFLNKYVLPPDKPVELFQWSGDCEPPPDPIRVLNEMGIPNINGGDPMFDTRFNSVSFLCPLVLEKGGEVQVNTSGSNENIYTDGWVGYKGAYNNVIGTFVNGESPIRYLPVNIYYHVFPAELQIGLRAIQNAYEWAVNQDLCWIRAVEYVRAVESWLKVRLGETEDGGWWVEDYGTCPSLRFDQEERLVDMAHSQNIAGFVRHNDSLYVSLIPGERAEVRFTDQPLSSPCLARASGTLRNIQAGEDSWQSEMVAWGGRQFQEIWVPGGDWQVEYRLPGEERVVATPERQEDGRLRVNLPDCQGKWLTVVWRRNG
ncbi:MAG: hypothetical protein LBU79_08255 [Planctomycetota bacterium]|jgi:hypothetical protein|nr:hypothetical protein [Planctomycetota bacterium]